MNLTNQIKKALLVSAFFYALSPVSALANCVLPAGSEAARIKQIVDGDTLKLQSGVTVRMLGINTPEIARRGVAAQPLALQATQALRDVLGENIYVVDGDQAQDHYGRRLSHVFSATGRSAEEMLISQGLGFFIGSDPATGMATCLRAAEKQAREAKRGVWGDPYWTPMAFNSQDLRAGFVVLQGTISSIDVSSKAVWIETRGDVVLRVDSKDKSRFSQAWWQQLEGRHVLVKGWMIDRKGRQGPHKRWLVRLMYPDMLVLLD